MISGLLSAELSATCNALGYSSGSSYYTDPYVKETITDLIRFLRRDDEDHTIRRHLGCAKILQTDLLPILIHHSDKEELFDVLLRLLVNLTNPALLIYQEELPAERTARHYFLQLISQLQTYKEAFTQQKVWEILAKKLGDLMQIEYHERDEDQSRTMERILILARNVLQVPADHELEKRPDNDASVHDQVLWSLHQAGMVDLFLYIASTDNEQQYYMHILEIVSLMLREQNPAMLASAALQRSVEEKERDEKELLEIRRKEIIEKQTKVKKYAGSRHSRFGGTFIIKDVKSISDNDMIFHKPLTKAVNMTFDFEKQRSKVPKNKLALSYQSSERRSAFSVRLFLKEFCVEFLNGAYNPLMYKVRENLVRKVGQANDETYFFWAMKFFMEFNRLYKFQVKLISETMHQQIFHFVQTTMENWLELMVTEKKKIPVLSRRIHQALKAYQELLMTLQEMDRSGDKSVRDSARVIKSNVFYQSEYRELVIFLFNVYTEVKFSKSYLKDLVETAHVFLKMLQHFCTKTQNLMVQGKAKKKPKTKKKSGAKKSENKASAADLELIWDEVGPELSAVLQFQANIPADIVPFDAASDVSMADQKVEAMKNIQSELKQGNYEQAIGLLRASREVWPENDSFGHANMATEDEFLAMREIFMTDLGQPVPAAVAAGPDGEEGNSEESDEEDEARDIVVPEYSFNFKEFVGRFACPRVLQPVCLLLESYDTNTQFTNHCIMKLLHRVAWDCKLPAMLFQATVFRTFQRVFKTASPEHKEIYKFAIYIMRKFAEMSKTNPKIYMELLLWKSQKDAYELEVGYGNVEKTHSAKNVWKEEQEDELRRLAAEYERDLPETDAVGWIMKNMIDQTRSRRAVQKKLKELYLVVGNMKEKPSKEFKEEEVSELKALFEEFKSSDDPMTNILERLSTKRSRRAIAEKLLELELVKDKKELKKKRQTKSSGKSSRDDWGRHSDDESIYDSWSDEDKETNQSSLTKKKKTPTQRLGQPSVAQMCCKLRKAVEAGLQEPLEWLKTSLQEVLEDLPEADDDDEGTALLPLNPSCVQAMENPFFLQLLDIFSIDKPTDQEVYWRIPGRWKSEDLNKRINLIVDGLEGKLPEIHPDDVEEMAQLPGIPRSSRSSPGEKRRKKKRINKSEGNKTRESDEESKRASSDSSSENDISSQRSRNLNRQSSRRDSSVESSDVDEQRITSTQKNSKPTDTSESDSNKENDASVSPAKSKNQSDKAVKNKLNMKMKRIMKFDSDSDDDVVSSTQKSPSSASTKDESSKCLDNLDSEDEQKSSTSTPLPIVASTQISSIIKVLKKDKSSKRKRVTIDSESDNDNTPVVNASNTVKSESCKTKLRKSKKFLNKKRFSIDSDSSSDDEKIENINSTVISSKANSLDKEGMNITRKRISIQSDDDSEDNESITKNLKAPFNQKSSRAKSNFLSLHEKGNNSSESGNEKNTTMNNTKTTIASSSQRSSRANSESPSLRKRETSSSESDNEENNTMNSTRTTIASPSQRSSQANSESPSLRKRQTSSSESDNEKNTTMNNTKTTIASSSQRSSRANSESPSLRKRQTSSSESGNEKNTTMNNTKTTIASSSQRSSRANSESPSLRKRQTSSSESGNEKNTTMNNLKTTIASSSQRSSRANSESPSLRKRETSSSESDNEENNTMNLTRTTIASPSQRNSQANSESPSLRKRQTSSSESDNEKNNTMNSTRTTIASPSQRSSQANSESPSLRKRQTSSSESDNEKNSTMNSTRTTIASPGQRSSQNTDKSPSSRKRFNSSSDSEDNQSTKIGLIESTETHVKKKKRLSIDSDDD